MADGSAVPHGLLPRLPCPTSLRSRRKFFHACQPKKRSPAKVTHSTSPLFPPITAKPPRAPRMLTSISSLPNTDDGVDTNAIDGVITTRTVLDTLEAFERGALRASMERAQLTSLVGVADPNNTNSMVLRSVAENSLGSNSMGGSSMAAMRTTSDESCERVTKALFQLDLTMHSNLMQCIRTYGAEKFMKQLRRSLAALGLTGQRQLGREELHELLSHSLRNRHINVREVGIMFDLFDGDLSGLVSCEEMLEGMKYLVETNPNELAYRITASLITSEEKAVKNSLISKFELDLLMNAVAEHCRAFHVEEHRLEKLREIANAQDFKYHRGRVPVMMLQSSIRAHPDVLSVFQDVTPTDDAKTVTNDSVDAIPATVPTASSRTTTVLTPIPPQPQQPKSIRKTVSFGNRSQPPGVAAAPPVSSTAVNGDVPLDDASLGTLPSVDAALLSSRRRSSSDVDAAMILRRMQPDRFICKVWDRQAQHAPEHGEPAYTLKGGVIYWKNDRMEDPVPLFHVS